ncbi:MAG TPA: SpoIID/LytB domain-containing protein [Actinomycetota bacterium]|nr:SpoIID/LytB domain-containing protein [Actinomycetota bacterium]
MTTRLSALVVALILLLAGAAPAAEKKRSGEPGALRGPVRLVPTSSTPLEVRGLHSYLGELEIDVQPDGLVLANELTLERYLLGLNEVPLDWPEEALQAQAIAARTYALFTLSEGPAGAAADYGFDICASVECQVFAGADVVLAEDGDRWAAAVADTAGDAILYDGAPILARYHSTSGGVTFDNPQIFTDEQDYPYLRGVESPTERASPLFRWRARFRIARLQTMLVAGGLWSEAASGELVSAETVPSAEGLHYLDVVLTGSAGDERVTAEELRDVVRDQGPELFPKAYPGRSDTGSGRLPETLPSNRYEMRTVDGTARVVGRGWGHGVGMSQYGAYGLALRGVGHRDILEHYYTGIEIRHYDVPPTITVGLAWGLDRIVVDGGFSIVDVSGETVVEDALGTWAFELDDHGALRVDPPVGYGLPLRIALLVDDLEAIPGETLDVPFSLSKPARVTVVTDPGGSPTDPLVFSAGGRTIEWTAPDVPGTYLVALNAQAARADRTTEELAIEVALPPPTFTPEARRTSAAAVTGEQLDALPIIVGVAVVGFLFFLTLAVTMGRRSRRRAGG